PGRRRRGRWRSPPGRCCGRRTPTGPRPRPAPRPRPRRPPGLGARPPRWRRGPGPARPGRRRRQRCRPRGGETSRWVRRDGGPLPERGAPPQSHTAPRPEGGNIAPGRGRPGPARKGSVRTTEVAVDTSRAHVVDLTDAVDEFVHGQGEGLLSVCAPHATAGLALMETGSGSEEDLEELLERVLPREDRYRHRHGSRGHGGDH